jgi:hypothetical protein
VYFYQALLQQTFVMEEFFFPQALNRYTPSRVVRYLKSQQKALEELFIPKQK